MRTIKKCMLFFLILLCLKGQAATSLVLTTSIFQVKDSGITSSMLLVPSLDQPHKSIGFIRKLQIKLLQNNLKHRAYRLDEVTPRKKNLLSTISLILGLAGAIAIFIPAISILGVIAGPAALVTGIIALGKKNNNSNASRWKAIAGLVLGAVVIFLALLALVWWAIFLNALV
jgi:hypothetical protein